MTVTSRDKKQALLYSAYSNLSVGGTSCCSLCFLFCSFGSVHVNSGLSGSSYYWLKLGLNRDDSLLQTYLEVKHILHVAPNSWVGLEVDRC